jgi:hypothetical protein
MLLALVTPLLLAASPVLGVALRTEARSAAAGEGDLQLNPALSLNAPLKELSLLLSYTPRLLFLEPQTRGPSSVLHRGHLRLERRFKRDTRLFFDQQFLYGLNDFSWLVAAAEGGQPSLDRLSQLPPLRYFSENTAFGIEQALARRLRLSTTAIYNVNGGADSNARLLVPAQHGPRVGLSIAWSARSGDSLTASVAGTGAFFSTGRRAYVVEVNGAWRHQLGRDTHFDVAAGAAGARQFGGDVPASAYTQPSAEVGLRKERAANGRLAANLRIRLAPAIDPVFGFVYARADGYAGIDYFLTQKLKFSGTAGAARALTGSPRLPMLWVGGIAAGYDIDRHLNLTGGMRVASQPAQFSPQPAPDVAPQRTTQWVGFVALTLSYGQLF